MKPVNHYMRLIFTADNQTTYGNPTSINSNLPDLSGYEWCRIIVEKAVVNSRDPSNNPTDAVSYLTIELKNNSGINQAHAKPIGSTSSQLIDVLDGEYVAYGDNVVMKYTNKKQHIEKDGLVVPTNSIQNNNLELELKLADGSLITQPATATLRDYIIVLGIELIK